jgi:dihydroorotate dehydrogenase electron transfer subunit
LTQDKKVLLCELISNECIADGIFKLAIRSAELAAAQPGQFAMLKCGGATFLRRPLSVCDACVKTGTVVFIYRLAGAGT